MWRQRAVRALLIEEIGALPRGGDDETPEEEALRQDEDLQRARRRTQAVVALHWLALVVLFLLRPDGLPFFNFAGTDGVFTVGVLLVAAHSGFRLGQLEKLNAVARAVDELDERLDED